MYCTCHKPSLTDASSYSHWLSMVYILKGRLLKNLLVFFAKNRRFNVFFHRLSPNRGERGKNSLFGPRQTPSAKIGHVGVYFAKMGCKIEYGFMDIFGLQSWNLVFGQSVILLGLNNTRSTNKFCSQKRKMASAISFLPLFWLCFNERIYEYGDKVKLLISWKSVDFKPQFW